MKKYLLFAAAFCGHAVFGQELVGYGLVFHPDRYVSQRLTVDGKVIRIRAYENIVDVAHPVDTAYEKINIYIPEEYFEGRSVNGYTAATAPIFYPNMVGGYMAAGPATALASGRGGFPGGPPPGGPGGPGNRAYAIALALARGYVVASAGARGRTTRDSSGIYTGKAPADIVDLKAGIRYLKYNDSRMPGDANKIVSNGTSAGGALSVLLGATGDNPDYELYLNALGAADASDDIFAVSAYCPITDLDHADMAYEWQFSGISDNGLSAAQIRVSKQLKQQFPTYLNSLHLTGKDGSLLVLDGDGNGSFRELVKSYVLVSAQKALAAGKDLSKLSWLKINDGRVSDLDFDAYVRYLQRMKTPPAFDALDVSAGGNQLFGSDRTDRQHFTDFSSQHSTVKASTADAIVVRMMNPMYYIGHTQTTTARHWRIRHGTKDNDTSLAIPVILATYLQNKGFDADLELPWDRPHSGDYDLDELFRWIDGICK